MRRDAPISGNLFQHSTQTDTWFLDAAPGATLPYYSSFEGAIFENATAAAPTKPISTNDTPMMPVPMTYDQGIGVSAGDTVVAHIEIRNNFKLWLVASTKEKVNGADDIYTGIRFIDWAFVGNSDVTYAGGGIPGVAWTGASIFGNPQNYCPSGAGWVANPNPGQPPDVISGTLANTWIQNDVEFSE